MIKEYQLNHLLHQKTWSCFSIKEVLLKEYADLQVFIDSHCHATRYGFQVKKCNKSVTFCSVLHSNRLEDQIIDTLKFLPETILDQSKQHCKNFVELYGTVPMKKVVLHSSMASKQARLIKKTSFLLHRNSEML